ncbi:LysE family translocator [Aurantiacibacter flavus]|uniref:LysE family transporter n=1 Tax=Aurantiacibacter flavus TaxID=3145232 RepID=A0ABV0CX96_9SPHN
MDYANPLLVYAAALAIAAVIPGPGVAALVGQSLAGGMRASMFFLIGIALGDLTYLTFAVAGLAVLAQTFARRDGATGLSAVAAGYAVTMSNPKTIIFYLALLPTVVELETIAVTQWAELCLVTVLVLAVTLSPYAVLADRVRAVFGHASALHRLNRIAAGIIGTAGVVILGQAASAMTRRA